MTSKYSIIQYVPNPIADERINIGVLAFDDHRTLVYFLRNWDRVRRFGMEDIGFLKDFAARTREVAESGLLFPGDENNEIPKHDRLLRVAQSWMNSIQFTEPRASLKELDRVLEDAIKKFLIEPVLDKPKLLDRQGAARKTISSVKRAVKKFTKEEYQDLVKEKYVLRGTLKGHEIDIAVANGHPYLAAQGISFEIHPPENLLDALSWTITDIKDNNRDFPLGVVVFPPKNLEGKQDKLLERKFQNTTEIYRDLGAKILIESEVESWVSNILNQQDDLIIRKI
jgi:Protein of unknown function (DUF3037)